MYDDDDYDYKYVARFVIKRKDIFGSGDLSLSLSPHTWGGGEHSPAQKVIPALAY